MTSLLMTNMVLCLILGMGLGVCGGMLGIGGGLIAIPVLGMLFGMNQHLAQGTALIMITPNVLIGFLRYRQRNKIDTRMTLMLCAFATVSAYFAAHIASAIQVDNLQQAFAIFLLVLATYYIWQWINSRRSRTPTSVLSKRYLPALGVASGFMSGIFTVGGGLVGAGAGNAVRFHPDAGAGHRAGAGGARRAGGAGILHPGRQCGLGDRHPAGDRRHSERVVGRGAGAQTAGGRVAAGVLSGVGGRGGGDAGGEITRRKYVA